MRGPESLHASSEMARKFDEFSPADVCSFLRENVPSISEELFQAILDHKIDGEIFVSLTDDHLREIAPLLGDRLKIKRLLTKTAAGLSNVSTFKHITLPFSQAPSDDSPLLLSSFLSNRCTSTPSTFLLSSRRSLMPRQEKPDCTDDS